MTAEQFNVILDGTTLPGRLTSSVVPELAKLIKRDNDFAAMLLRGEPARIRSGVDAATGARYVEALQRIGVAVHLELETLDVDADIATPQYGADASRSSSTGISRAQRKRNAIIGMVAGLLIVGGTFGGYRYGRMSHESDQAARPAITLSSIVPRIADACDKTFLVELEANPRLTHLQRLEIASSKCNGQEIAVSGVVADVGRGGPRSVDIVGPDGLEYGLFLSQASQCGDTVLLQKGQKISIRGRISSAAPHFPKYFVDNVVCVK
jgi:hypothetical protein